MRIITKIIEFFKEVRRRVKEKERENKLQIGIIPVKVGMFKPQYVVNNAGDKMLAVGCNEEGRIFVVLNKYGWEIKEDVYKRIAKDFKVDKRFIGKKAWYIEKKDLSEY